MSNTPSSAPQQQPQSTRPGQAATGNRGGPSNDAAAFPAFDKFSISKSSASKSNKQLPYTAVAQAALLAHSKHDRDRPSINSPNPPNPVPTRTAILFLGKDWERWHRYDRDSSLQLGWQPRGVASAVTDCRVSPHASSSSSSGESSDDDYIKHAAVFSSDDDEDHNESDIASTLARSDLLGTSSGSNNESDVFSLQRRMTRRARLLSSTSTSTILESTSSRPHSPAPFSPSPHIRERRYSSNGPEAAFLRHETVIGIHTPRSVNSNSPASSSGCRTPSERRFPLAPLSQILPSGPSSSADGHQQQRQAGLPSVASASSSTRRTSAPTTQESVSAERHTSHGHHHHHDQQAPSVKDSHAAPPANASAHRTASAQTVNPNATPAARKISLADVPLRKKSQVSKSHKEPASVSSMQAGVERASKSTLKRGHSAEKRTSDHPSFLHARRSSRSASLPASQLRKRRPHRIHLEPATRRPSVAVQGTLYDEEGPFVEGAVQDGLSVRIFNGPDMDDPEPKHDDAGESDKQQSPLGLSIRTQEHGEQSRPCAYMDSRSASSGGIVTYLITTPDNRVSSAAKLRRWAMDSRGNFYAAMEIKSVEAKLRAGGVLPNYPHPGSATANGSSPTSSSSAATAAAEEEAAEAYYYTRQLIRSMQETYVDDIVSEIQKAQTLNPGRSTVSRLLKTEDDKYVRLEEDYPEEAFFVMVGCEEYELYPVVVLVFVEALRALARFHDAGWLHGDVKLENLMFDVKGNLVVIDYENANMFRKPVGTSSTMAMSARRRKRPNTSTGAGQSRSSSLGGNGAAHTGRRPTSSRGRKTSSRPSSRRGNGTTVSELTVPLDGSDHLVSGGDIRSSSGSPSASPGRRRATALPSPEMASNGVVVSNGSASRDSSSQRGVAASKTMARDASHTSSHAAYADDEAGLSDGEDHEEEDTEDDEEHLVRLISYDWTPPEASSSYAALHGSSGNGNGHQGSGGRMMGPSGDLWALGCNLIRAFALRDGVPDMEVREVLLGSGQRAFFKHRAQVLANWQRVNGEEAAAASAAKDTEGPAAEDGTQFGTTSEVKSAANASKLTPLEPPSSPAARVLHRFGQEAPRLMHYVLARCVTPHPSERSWEAELEGLKLAEELEQERLREPIPLDGALRTFGSGNTDTVSDPAQAPLRKVDAEEEDHEHGVPTPSPMYADPRMAGLLGPEPPLLIDVARAAILKAIDISGSMWVRPKLEEARRSLGFGCGANEGPGHGEGDSYYGYEADAGADYEQDRVIGPHHSQQHYY